MLIVTVRRKLEESYGSDKYEQIRAALDAYAQPIGAAVLAVDDQGDCGKLNLSPIAGADSGSILLAVRAARAKLASVAADSLLIVGGDWIVPQCQIINPVQDQSIDKDPVVYTDNPYGAASETLEEYLAPSVPVGRIVDDASGNASDFVALIQRLGNRGRDRLTAFPGSTLVVYGEQEDKNGNTFRGDTGWVDDSTKVATALPGPQDWHFSPGYQLSASTRADAARPLLYFNLHGFSGDPDWKGYSMKRRDFVTAVSPDGFDRAYVSGAIAFAECCYGAEMRGRTPDNSCALKLQNEGAAFVGSTGLAFGSYMAPGLFLDDADFLARSFFSGLAGGGSVGVSLRNARKAYLSDTSENLTSVDWQYKQKTLLQFMLLGDPRWTM
jgi:hypothetical protein